MKKCCDVSVCCFLRDEQTLRSIVWGNVRGVVRMEVPHIEGGRAADRVGKENVFVKPNEQNRACWSYAMARKRRMKSNVFVKPNEQKRACSSYGMARKRRMKSKFFSRRRTCVCCARAFQQRFRFFAVTSVTLVVK